LCLPSSNWGVLLSFNGEYSPLSFHANPPLLPCKIGDFSLADSGERVPPPSPRRRRRGDLQASLLLRRDRSLSGMDRSFPPFPSISVVFRRIYRQSPRREVALTFQKKEISPARRPLPLDRTQIPDRILIAWARRLFSSSGPPALASEFILPFAKEPVTVLFSLLPHLRRLPPSSHPVFNGAGSAPLAVD